MEDWQKKQIKTYLSSLVENTSVNVLFLAKLQEKNVLSDEEVAQINVEKNSYEKSKLLYEIIVKKANCYDTLVTALTDTQQSGATKYLFHPSEKIRNLKVHFQGKTQQLGNLLSNNQIKNIQTWLLDTQLSEAEYKASVDILKEQGHVKLLRERDTIPKHYDLYIPRFVSVAQILDPDLFQKSCPDTFVFENLKRSDLGKLVKTYEIESSTQILLRRKKISSGFVLLDSENDREKPTYDIKPSTTQLPQQKITARFILLESENDWEEICAEIPETPVHLLKYDEETDEFVVKATSGGSHILWEHLRHKDTNPEYISEQVFVEQILTKNVKGVCICDSPGMGKSDLLASIARRIEEKCPESITCFIQLRDFVAAINPSINKKDILDIVCTSKLASEILHELTKDGSVQFNLFFDGLDEVYGTNLEQMMKFFRELIESIPEARLYVTGRPVARAWLEKLVGLIAYNIMPLTEETQRNYLTKSWLQKNRSKKTKARQIDEQKLNEFAEYCVQSFGKALKENIKTVSGAPLQCQLVADVYFDDAAVFADKDRLSETPNSLLENIVNSLSEIYSKFMFRQLGPSKCRFACMHKLTSSDKSQCDVVCKVKSFHVWQALRLIDRYFIEKIILKGYVTDFHDLTSDQILSPGILKPGKNDGTYEFLHRTFAEFLVAEYSAKVLLSKPNNLKRNKIYDKIAKEFLVGQILFHDSDDIHVFLQRDFFVGVRSIKKALLPYFVNVSLTDCFCAGDELCVVALSPNAASYSNVRSCLHADYQSLLKVLLHGIQNFEQQYRIRLRKVFNRVRYAILQDQDNEQQEDEIDLVLDVLRTAAQYSDVTTIDQLFMFFQDGLHFDVTKLTKVKCRYLPLPMEVAVNRGDFHVVENLIANKFNLKNLNLLYWCFKDTYYQNEQCVKIRLEIAQLLISKQANLLTEKFMTLATYPFGDNFVVKRAIPVILSPNIHLEAIKFLVKAGVNVKTVDGFHRNVYIHALCYMSDEDFENLRSFLFIECNAQNWFLDLENHKKYFCSYGDHHIKSEKTMLRFLQNMVKETALVPKNENDKTDLLRSETYKGLFFHAVVTGRIEIVDYFLEQDPTFLEQRHSEKHPDDLFHLLGLNVTRRKYWNNVYGVMEQIKLVELRHSEYVTPILLAAKLSQTEMVRLLVNRRANIFAVDAKGRTILHLSAISGKSEPFEEIVRMVCDMQNTSLPSYQRDSNSQKEPASVQELFNWHDNGGQNTPLHKAAQYIDLSQECLSLFLSCGQAVKHFALPKSEPISNPCEKNDEAISVNVNAVNTHGHTGLHVALIHKQKLELVEHLVTLGANWRMRDNQGCNVAHICAWMELGTHLNYFLSLGGTQFANQLDNAGNNALQCALVKWTQNRAQERFYLPSELMRCKENKRKIIEELKRMGCEAKTELASFLKYE